MQHTEGDSGLVSQSNAIPISYLTYASEVLREHGLEINRYLEAVGLPTNLLASDVTEISQEHYYELLFNILETVDIPGLGLKVGQKFSIADYGILGYAVLSCPTLGHAIHTFLRFQEIVGSSASFSEEIHIEENATHISVHCQQIREPLLRFEVEESIGQWISPSGLSVWTADFQLSRVEFTFSDPGYSDLYRSQFRCPVRFNQPANRMYFPAELLDQSQSMANETTSRVCQQQCESILENLKQQGGLVEQVRRIVINQPGQPPSPEEIARRLNMSYRTLRRRLNDHETSVTKILYDVRMSLAQQYLQQTVLSLQEIAFLLGYDEVNNFYRAFKKWSGQTAAEYRSQHREK